MVASRTSLRLQKVSAKTELHRYNRRCHLARATRTGFLQRAQRPPVQPTKFTSSSSGQQSPFNTSSSTKRFVLCRVVIVHSFSKKTTSSPSESAQMKAQLVCLCLLAVGVLTVHAADKNFDYEETGKRPSSAVKRITRIRSTQTPISFFPINRRNRGRRMYSKRQILQESRNSREWHKVISRLDWNHLKTAFF